MTSPDFGLSIIASWIANRIDQYLNSKKETPIIVKNEEEEVTISEVPPLQTEVLQLSQRFQRILELMNENRGEYNKFTIAKLSELLGLNRRSDLENIFLGNEEPTFDFIKNFCKVFRINYDWLNEGKGNPFAIDYYYGSPLDYFDDIIKLNPERIFFIQKKSDVAETFIMLGFSDWYYIVCTKYWHISNHVGAGGQSQIYDFYLLIKKLKENLFSSKCFGLKLESEEFNNILYGKSFPGSCLIGDMGLRTNHPWWDDFTDIEHYYPISDQYEEMHGKSFIDAQNIVKDQIERYHKENV
jgi:transcriptional regulator with XRE-family HTH domain